MNTNYPDYEGYEDLGGFTAPQLLAYRQMLLDKTKAQVDFIKKHVPKYGKVLEIGSGNGRLLIAMAERGLLEHGAGLDLSQSRVQFANKWADDTGHDDKMTFVNSDVLNRDHEGGFFDLAVCITGCFQYFFPISPDAPLKVMTYMRKSAKYSLFELYKRPKIGRTWRPLPEEDQFVYLLDEYEEVESYVRHTKRFVGLTDKGQYKHDTKIENLAYYSMYAFKQLLQTAGYKKVLYSKETRDSMVVLAG